MLAAVRAIKENAKLVDVVIEVVDARAPAATRSPMLGRILSGRQRVIALAKSDLAEPDTTSAWVERFAREGVRAFAIDSRTGEGVRALLEGCRAIGGVKAERLAEKGIRRPLRLMVVGVPNVGKSSLINRMTGRAAARTGAKPGITRGKQWIRIAGDMEVLDLPGILEAAASSMDAVVKMVLTGIIPDDACDPEEAALVLLEGLAYGTWSIVYDAAHGDPLKNALETIVREGEGGETQQDDRRRALLAGLEEYGRRRGCMAQGGRVDLRRSALMLIKEVRDGRYGKISLERPEQ